MVQPRARGFACSAGLSTPGAEGAEDALSDNGTDFAGRSGETVGGGAVTCGEAFAWHDERGAVWSEVEEELSEDVEGEEGMAGQMVVREADDNE